MKDRTPHLSATQINMFLRCPRQYAFRYIEGIKSPPSGAMKQSGSWHRTVERNYRQKVESKKDLPVDEMTDFYEATFKEDFEREEVVLDEGQSKDGLLNEGIWITRAHHKSIAPVVQPAMVEQRIELSLGKDDMSYELWAILDLVDFNDLIRDNKALSRTPTQDDLDRDIQLSTYALAYRLWTKKPESGLAHDVVVKKKNPEALTISTKRTREGLRLHLNLMGHIARGIRAEAFPMNPTGWWCSKRFCGYWDRCMGRGLVTVDMGANK